MVRSCLVIEIRCRVALTGVFWICCAELEEPIDRRLRALLVGRACGYLVRDLSRG